MERGGQAYYYHYDGLGEGLTVGADHLMGNGYQGFGIGGGYSFKLPVPAPVEVHTIVSQSNFIAATKNKKGEQPFHKSDNPCY